MPEQAYITKSKAPYTSMNYEDLRTLGISNIQQLAAATWTDHNLHDPGITILELLSYAITDLGHRTNYAMQDILAENFDEKSPLVSADYTIKQILPCNPVTIIDWRKLLVDLPAVRNAWVKLATPESPRLFNHYPENTENNEGTLTYTESPSAGTVSEEILIQGLYEVYLELEEVENLGDLNSPSIFRTLEDDQSGETVTHQLEFIFPRWSQLHRIWYTEWEITNITLAVFNNAPATGDYSATLNIETTEGLMAPLGITIYASPSFADKNNPAVLNAINDFLTGIAPKDLIPQFYQKVFTTAAVLENVKQYLMKHRNVCEDFLKIDLICYQEIVLNGDLIVHQGTDPDQISSIIYFLIEQFLRPLIRFRTLAEMKSLGYVIDEVFAGPLLNNGFLHDDDFDGSLLEGEDLEDKTIRALVRNAYGDEYDDQLIIYTSDLIRIIMCIKKNLGIIAVRNFSISSFLDNVLEVENAKDCLVLENAYRCKPKLSIGKSVASLNIKTESLTALGETETLDVDLALVQAKVDALQETLKQNLSDSELTEINTQLSPKTGKVKHIQNYYSLQNDFPLTYGIGRSGLTPDVADSRRAKARQLKAYLLFFEQFLANYQAQLGHVKELFSIDRRVKQTYFTQDLYNVPDAYLLLKSFVDDHPENIDNYSLISASWVTFKENLSNYYLKKIQEWAEEPETYLDRRNRFLDYMLARFGEDFNDYSALRYFIDQDKIEQELISCKIDLLENIPIISRDRGRAFNYCEYGTNGTPAPWVAYQQSGYKLRLTKLLGLKDHTEVYQEVDADSIDEFRFRIKNSGGDILLSSSQHYLSTELNLMYEHIRTIKALAKDLSNYQLATTTNGKFYFNIIDSGGDILARRIQYFNTALERQTAINEVIAYLSNELNFHFIEHILLRPASGTDPLMQTKEVELTAIKDPYSFGLSIVFPAFVSPFDNLLFRSYAEKITYLETPAHLLGEIYWVEDQTIFESFEDAYYAWLNLRAQSPPVDDGDHATWLSDIQNALDDLITALDVIRTT